MAKNEQVKVVEEETVAAEVLASAIVKLAKGMEALANTRLTRNTIVTLIHANSKVAKRDIELVLNNLEALERIWLKPVKK